MFKSARWRNEKNKIKSVFKLQFHATQLTQLAGDSLIISVIPADIGKPTSRLEKAKVRDGICYWEKSLYETVKFSQDPKTGKFFEKIYHFIVAKDSSRFGSVGEISIDFANYAEATKLSSLSLPLKNANSAAVLHVLVERVQGSVDQREIDECENASPRDRSLRSHFGNLDLQDHGTTNGINKDHQTSVGSEIMISRSNSSSGLNTPQKHELKNTKLNLESSITKDRSLNWEFLNATNPKLSTDDSSTSTLEETSEEGSSDTVIQNLKVKVAALTRQADVSELELQTLRKQIVKEMKKNQDLSKEVVNLKEECENLKGFQNRGEEVNIEVKVNGMLLIGEGDPWALIGELRQELNHEKNLTSDLRLQLKESQESNAELALALEKSKSKSKSEIDDDDDDEEQRELEAIVREHSGVKETYLLEQKIIDLYNEIELYKRDKDEIEMQMEQIALDYEILKQENHDISYKLERSQLEEQLKMQYEYTTSDTSVNELEMQIKNLEHDLKSKVKELSKSTLVIKELESHIKNLEEELDNQAREFELDLENLSRAKTEQEQRVINAEDNLRKIKLQNAKAATRLQEEVKRLSQKMAYTFEVNEKAAMKANDEANKLRVEKRVLEDTLFKVKTDLENLDDSFQEKMVFLENQITHKSKQIENMIGEFEDHKQIWKTEIQRLNVRIENLESERLNEIAIDSSETFFLNKEKDLQLEIEELERKLDFLVQKTDNLQ